MRYALLIAYDGTDFSGWWRQPHQRTVAGVFDEAFARLAEPQAHVVGTSRTDAGVHAEGQVAHVDTLRSWSPMVLLNALNQHLPIDAVCRHICEMPETWDACHHAVAKTYRYSLDAGSVADPFCARFAWRTPFRLSLTALQRAAEGIAGERDWRGFSKRGETRHFDGDLIRRIDTVAWSQDGARWLCHMRGGGFTFRLVRSLVGAMVAVAHGTCTHAELAATLRGEDSPAGMQQAPAQGLCLEHILHTPSPRWG